MGKLCQFQSFITLMSMRVLLRILLVYEWVIEHFDNWDSIAGVLFQTLLNEVHACLADTDIFGKVNLFFNLFQCNNYHFLQVVLASDLERNSAVKQLIRENPNVPYIYLSIILHLIHQLRRRINGRPTKRPSGQRRIHRPSKITQLNYILH